jgi:ubiquinone/menaquinone biosynthesis C-methylase UbiE
MSSGNKDFIEKQKEQWDRVAPAWEKWDEYLDVNMAFVNYRLVGDARLRQGQKVLDLGSGTGYPAILAAQAVGDKGSVVGLDLSAEMLSVARRKAQRMGLTNVTFKAGDVSRLDFNDNSFDAVLSRFCLMFLPDVQATLNEIARVLKSGGYLTAAVWSMPDKNPFITTPIQVLKDFTDVPAPAPNQPGIFQLAAPGLLSSMAEKAGLKSVAEEEMIGRTRFESAEEYLENLKDLAAPLKPLFTKLAAEDRDEAEARIRTAADKFSVEDHLELPMAFRVVVACKG